MILEHADRINAMFRPELGAPERLVDSIAWPLEVDKDVITDKLFTSTVPLPDGGYFTLSPMGVLCSGRKYIEQDAVRRLIASTLDYRLNHREQDTVQNLVMYAGPEILNLSVKDTPLSEHHLKGLELLQEKRDVWTWLVGAKQGTLEYDDIPTYAEAEKQERDDAIVDLYEMITTN